MMPIKDGFELLVTTNRLEEFKKAHDEIVNKLGSDALLTEIVLFAINSMIDDLEKQRRDYLKTLDKC